MNKSGQPDTCKLDKLGYHFNKCIMDIEIIWTPKKQMQVLEAIEKWIRDHDATAGEVIMQSDECIISAPEFLSDLVDNIIKPKRLNGGEDDDQW